MKKILVISLLFSLAFVIQCSMVYAQADNGTDLNLTSFPDLLAEKLSVSNFAGGIIASLLLTFMFVLPTAIFTKTIIPPLFVGMLCLCACVALTWLEVWVLLILALLSALLFANKMSTLITGAGGKD